MSLPLRNSSVQERVLRPSQVVSELGATLDSNESSQGSGGNRWVVSIFNNDVTLVEHVVDVLICATGCDVEEATIETWEAHTYGKAPVHFAGKPECERVAEIISTIGVQTEVALEWND